MPVLPAKVLLISDEPESAEVWGYILDHKGFETSLVTSNEEDSTERRPDHTHDVIIIDRNNGHMNTNRLIGHLRTEVTVPILLLLPSTDEALALEGYEAGADEVIPKPISPRLLLAKIKAWVSRSWTVPAAMLDILQVGDLRLDPAQRQLVNLDGTLIKLTSLEFRLLHLLMSHPGQILESNLIIERVWGADSRGDSTLLKNVVYRLRRKIEPDPAHPAYIQSLVGEGYVFQIPVPI
jgi:two-component system response regulator RegX3